METYGASQGGLLGSQQARNLANNAAQFPGEAKRDRPPTEMEAMSEFLATTVRRLIAHNDKLETRIGGFTQMGATACSDSQAPEPQPGTIGSFRHHGARIDVELQRLDSLLIELAKIL